MPVAQFHAFGGALGDGRLQGAEVASSQELPVAKRFENVAGVDELAIGGALVDELALGVHQVGYARIVEARHVDQLLDGGHVRGDGQVGDEHRAVLAHGHGILQGVNHEQVGVGAIVGE